MERDYVGVAKRKLDDVYRTGSASASNVRGDKVERENRFAFMVLHLIPLPRRCLNHS
jgi:hypothetical protein